MASRSIGRLALLFGALALSACSHNASSAAAPAPSAASSASSRLPSGVTVAMVAVGDSVFHAGSCQRCHGPDAKGTARGPDLTDATWAQIDGTFPQIVAIVTAGVPKEKVKMPGAPFGMRPRGGINLTDDQVRDVSAYVYSISHR